MQSQRITYQADGLRMNSQLFYETGAQRRPGILVFPEAFGLGGHALSRAEHLAQMGYIALACDLHGDRRNISDLQEVMKLVGALHDEVSRTRARALAGLNALRQRAEVDPDKIAAIGFCFGGTMALELARSGANVAAVVGFHSGLATASAQDARNIKGKVLVCIGADDPGIPLDQRKAFEEEMRAGKVDWQMNVYGGVVHSFTNPDADKAGRPEQLRYDAKADARSWREMRALFDEVFAQK
ncbi:MAG: dienelactone hydrolase [Gammaproteobacteria bacterium]|jgi:dienelactone hydrolase|nr:dienelactone hydrolase [Gammaproteobacteria bacterium]